MTSTFHGLETARRALMAQQAALYTTGHNIANANTEGYSRQRVNLKTTLPHPAPGINQGRIAAQIGTGVKAGEVQRIRDSFTDMQFRTENSKHGYWEAKAKMLSQMEDIMNEPSDTGLARTLDEFWNALQDLAVQPQNDGARRVVRERGITLANTFNYMSNSIKAIQTDYRKEIDATQDKVNSLLRQINAINKQIGSIEPHGFLPNDLYDERDRLVDELSKIINIRVEVKQSGGLASASAEGLYDIYLADPTGEILMDQSSTGPKRIQLIDAEKGEAYGIHIQYEDREKLDSPVTNLKFFKLKENEPGFEINENPDNSTDSIYVINDFSKFKTQGSLKGYIEGYGYKENGNLYGNFNDMLKDLDQMAYTFATYFNTVHSAGWSLNEIANGEQDYEAGDFFKIDSGKEGAAASIRVAQHIIDDVGNIAAAAEGNVIVGSMKPDGSNSSTGSPTFIGSYDENNIPEDLGIVIDPDDSWSVTGNIIVELKYDADKWEFTFSGNSTTAEFTLDKDKINVTVFGITFDLSNVKNPNNGDTWTLEFNTNGVQPKDEAFIGNGSNALALSNVKSKILDYGGTSTDVQSFYQGMIGKLGDNASEANRMESTSAILRGSVEQRRLSETSVSLDEEMVNMIKFQHAYNAAARNITLIDEMLDRIINNMGIVGR